MPSMTDEIRIEKQSVHGQLFIQFKKILMKKEVWKQDQEAQEKQMLILTETKSKFSLQIQNFSGIRIGFSIGKQWT